MSENIIPEKIQEVVSDVDEKDAGAVQDLSGKSLAELSDLFVKTRSGEGAMSRSKELEAIKSAFYKLLSKLKGESDGEGRAENDPFEVVEQNFKAIYSDYKRERAEYMSRLEAEREESLKKKKAIIEELKALVEGQEDVSSQFTAFRELQNRWREAGPVPVQSYRDINDTYQYYVEKFYDMVKINRDLRDLDFKKNFEAKEAFCAAAEKLAENENVVNAFHELQKLHEQWKEYGPVAKEKREEIWDRFKAATSVINKKYQAHFEGLKAQQEENLEKKKVLCEKLEEIAEREIKNTADWNQLSKEIESLQAEWRTIGFATKKENQKIYDRFRAACDKFFERKREHYTTIKDSMTANLEKKQAIIEQAEALKSSTEWKKTADQLIALQKQWKEIGAVPRKKSEQLWKRFRAACDDFFAARDAKAKPENDYYANLKAKRAIIAEIKALTPDSGANKDEYIRRFKEIGFVPFKEKDNITKEFKDALNVAFPPSLNRNDLIRRYNALQQDIDTYENNIGFFSNSRNSEALVLQMKKRIEQAKEELKTIEEQIRSQK